jgi:hypothetical protein
VSGAVGGVLAPGSSAGVSVASPAISTGMVQGNYDGYVDLYPDLAAALSASSGHLPKSDRREARYSPHGAGEDRSLSNPGHHDDHDDDCDHD